MPNFTTELTPADREIARLRADLQLRDKRIAHLERVAEIRIQREKDLRAALREALDEIDCVEHASLRLKTTGRTIRMIKQALKEK